LDDFRSKEITVRKSALTATVAVVAALLVAACGSSSTSGSPSAGGKNTLIGAGSTLVAPLMSQWQPTYNEKNGVAITYGAIGSGGGIEQITARTVDFGASDAPMTPSQATACKSCLEIPWALAGTVVAYHVQGVPSHLKLTGPVLAKIWMGQIKAWNDPAIKALNPGVNLPSTPIQPVHRTDGSGDTYAFTNYLSKVSPQFKSKIGNAVTVNWPGGLGGKGNSGVGGVLSSTNGAIAYIAVSYVLQNNFDYALVQNAAGKYPTPGPASFSAAAKSLTAVPSGGTQGLSITDPPSSASDAYPISTFTYVLVPKSLSSTVAGPMKKFITWAVTDGQQYGPKLQFAPLPPKVVSAAKSEVTKIG
jgi:phosphate transport system substrate-binding protein